MPLPESPEKAWAIIVFLVTTQYQNLLLGLATFATFLALVFGLIWVLRKAASSRQFN